LFHLPGNFRCARDGSASKLG